MSVEGDNHFSKESDLKEAGVAGIDTWRAVMDRF